MSTPLQRRGVNRLIDLQEIGGSFSFAAGSLLVGDGSDSFDEQPVSGDATLAADGTLRVTKITDSNGDEILSTDARHLVFNGNTAPELFYLDTQLLMRVDAGSAGTDNTAFGIRAGRDTSTEDNNVSLGSDAGRSAGGDKTVCIGSDAGRDGHGDESVLIGYRAGFEDGPGNFCTLIGSLAGAKLNGATDNAFIGQRAGQNWATGDDNFFLGTRAAGGANAVGGAGSDGNIFIGTRCAEDCTSPTRCVAIGTDVELQSNGGTDQLSILNLIMTDDHGNATGTTISSANLGIGIASPTTRLHVDGSVRVGQYTVAGAPSASTAGAGAAIFVSNGAAGSPIWAFSDGTDWLRSDTGAAISAT